MVVALFVTFLVVSLRLLEALGIVAAVFFFMLKVVVTTLLAVLHLILVAFLNYFINLDFKILLTLAGGPSEDHIL